MVPTTKDAAPTEAGAVKRAEAIAGRMPGAATLCVTTDPETGEVWTITIIGTFGEVPDGFAESSLDG